jgi:hypothetical protein
MYRMISKLNRTIPLVVWFAVLVLRVGSAAQPPGHNVILVTLDGARVEEMFGGLDVEVLRSTMGKTERVEESPVYKRYWAADPIARREKLLPFFWGTLMRDHGSIAGNRKLGSRVGLANRHWFSYPGYAEMLVGRARDDVIKSNDPVQNPSPTVLEFLRERLQLPQEGVAVFASWNVFNAIAESRPGSITINAGFEDYDHRDAQVKALSALQFQTPTPWPTVRHDIYTARFALAHLALHKSRVLYLALGETDDWAHDGRYDRVLEAFARTDAILRELWTWLQTQPEYRGRTSLLITTDHGRGRGADAWRQHGAKYAGSEETWMAFISPHMSRRGEWRDAPALEARQVAATLLQWMDQDWRVFDPAAAPPVAAR